MNGDADKPIQETSWASPAASGAPGQVTYTTLRRDPRSSTVRFGPFRLQNNGDVLYRGEEAVRLGSRARLILLYLISRAGEVASRAEIMASVWPDTTVVENNLTVNITALRQALGDGQDGAHYIVNIPGRGYRFVAPIIDDRAAEQHSHQVTPVSRRPTFPCA